MGLARRDVDGDPAEAVARIAAARRGRLLRIHRRRLRWEDLEDCYSQATLELLARSRRAPFASGEHVLNALEQKFLSRIEDRRRALGGRSAIEAAIARAVPVDAPEEGGTDLEDRRAGVEHRVIARSELRRLREVIADLSRDQRLVLASQVCVEMEMTEFCARFGWSVEKYRKVAQRARAKLRVLVEEYELGERCRRLEPDLLAMSACVADPESLARARAHVANCQPCARMAGELDRAARSLAVLLPVPAALVLGGGLAAKLAGLCGALRRIGAVARHPLAETGAGGGAGVAGGGLAGVGALKVGLVAVCVAGAAGSYAMCAHLGVLPGVGLLRPAAPATIARRGERAARPLVHANVAARTNMASERVGTAPAAVIRSPARVVRVARSPHVSRLEQIRREFGAPPARAASSTAATARLRSPGVRAEAAHATATNAQVRQTQAEFGFENG